MLKNHFKTYKLLAIISLLFWLSSLPLTAIVLYGVRREPLLGIDLLIAGWAALLLSYVAWYANAFYFYGLYRLIKGKPSIFSPILAALLSIDTFRLDLYPTGGASGSTTPVYGYGWGALLWFVAILILIISAGFYCTSQGRQSPKYKYRGIGMVGFGLILFTVCMAYYLMAQDRTTGNHYESNRLKKVIFKRGAVCDVEVAAINKPIDAKHGPIEIVFHGYFLYASYPLGQVDSLLEWGIPMVRYKNTDFSIKSTSGDEYIELTPAVGRPAAILIVSEGEAGTIGMELKDGLTGRVVMKQVWKREPLPVNHNYYCPDYDTYPMPHEQPRQLLMKALGLEGVVQRKLGDRKLNNDYVKIEGFIYGDDGRNEAKTLEQYRDVHASNRAKGYSENDHCGVGVGFASRSDSYLREFGRPFIVRDKVYYLGRDSSASAICDGDMVYIYTSKERGRKYYIDIEKRQINGFQRIWARSIGFRHIPPVTQDNALKVLSIQDKDNMIAMEIMNKVDGYVEHLSAPIN